MGPWRIRRPPEWGVAPVPERLRGLRAFDLFVLWSSLGVGLLVFVAGSNLLLFFGLSLWEALAVSVAGSIIGSVLLAASGVLGSAHGVPTMVSLRAVLQWIEKFAIWMVFLSPALVAYRLLASGLDMNVRLAPGSSLGTTSLFLS